MVNELANSDVAVGGPKDGQLSSRPMWLGLGDQSRNNVWCFEMKSILVVEVPNRNKRLKTMTKMIITMYTTTQRI